MRSVDTHQERLKQARIKRLQQLEMRIARQGDSVDPSVVNEADDLRILIAGYDVSAPDPGIKESIQRRYGDELTFIIMQVAKFGERLTGVEQGQAAIGERLTEVEKGQAVASEWRTAAGAQLQEIVGALAAERELRVSGQKKNYRLSVVSVILCGSLFVIAVWLLFQVL